MARPTPTAKPSVNLASNPASKMASGGPRVSRIRRDPPPLVKEKIVYTDEDEQWAVIVGILVFALAIFALILAFSSYSAWSAKDHPIEVRIGE